jgi:hypothetical protein
MNKTVLLIGAGVLVYLYLMRKAPATTSTAGTANAVWTDGPAGAIQGVNGQPSAMF